MDIVGWKLLVREHMLIKKVKGLIVLAVVVWTA
jgi:hypothetical protein